MALAIGEEGVGSKKVGQQSGDKSDAVCEEHVARMVAVYVCGDICGYVRQGGWTIARCALSASESLSVRPRSIAIYTYERRGLLIRLKVMLVESSWISTSRVRLRAKAMS